MKVLAIVGTARKKGRVSSMCQRILDGAGESGHETELVNLFDYNVEFCRGCVACTKTGKCILKDDFDVLTGKEEEADIIIYGTPVYYSGISAILKNFLDRHEGYIIPYVKVHDRMSTRERLEAFRAFYQDYRAKRAFAGKKFIFVVACTGTSWLSHIRRELPHTLYVLREFVEKMKGEVFAKLVYTDTLFRFQVGKEERMMEKAHRLGKKINQGTKCGPKVILRTKGM